VPGSAVLACIEGTRPLLVEVQALVAPTVYAAPKRSSVGLDINRIAMLAAVLERRIGIPLGQYDIYVNVAGGAKISEPAADLAVLMAIISAYREKALPPNLALFGEVGLTGEIRPVGNPEARAREAANLGFEQLLLPRENETRVQESNLAATLRKSAKGLRCLPAKHLSEAVQLALA
jgi:DNA repair protein RadA/Sms